MTTVKFRRFNEKAQLPVKAHRGDLGYDLYALDSIQLGPGQMGKFATGIGVIFPPGFGGLILDRSSMAAKHLIVSGGVIDNEYTGELTVMLTNMAHLPYTVFPGDKIAQLVPIATTQWISEWHDEGTIPTTSRGENGFGSTGR